jgi:hypothetical protein
VRGRVRRIARNHLFEASDGLAERGLTQLVPRVASLQKERIRLWIDGPPARAGCLMAAADVHRNFAGDDPCDFRFERQNVADVAVVVRRPDLRVSRTIDELRADPNAIRDAPDRSGKEAVDIQIAGDFGNALPSPLKPDDRRSRDDLEPLNLRNRADECLGDAVGEVLLFGIPRQVVERKHGDRADP